MADADGNMLTFALPVPLAYYGGDNTVPGTGTRLYFGGIFVDLTAGNLSDLGAPLLGFASAGALS
jgi:hypothetical protein